MHCTYLSMRMWLDLSLPPKDHESNGCWRGMDQVLVCANPLSQEEGNNIPHITWCSRAKWKVTQFSQGDGEQINHNLPEYELKYTSGPFCVDDWAATRCAQLYWYGMVWFQGCIRRTRAA